MDALYVFLDAKLKCIMAVMVLKGDGKGTPAEKALKHRKKLGKNVVAFTMMGGDNGVPEWPMGGDKLPTK